MSASLRSAISGALLLAALAGARAGRAEIPFNPGAISDVAERVTPAVVNITTRKVRASTAGTPLDPALRELFGPESKRQLAPEVGAGSGVVVSADGFIVTNNHVVEGANDIRVTFADRREFTARMIGSDRPSDVALIKIEAKDLPTIPFGNSAKLRLGEVVLAVGNPFGIGQTVTMGIVSAKGRAKMGIVDYEDFIQTDASINPGNSGGALVNLQGELIGINTAIITRSGGTQGIGFAVPSNMVKPILEQVREFGRVRRGWIGVAIQDLTPEIARSFDLRSTAGVLISDVMDKGPASRANIEVGDVIVAVDGQTAGTASELRNRIALMRPGSRVKLALERGHRRLDVAVTLDEKEAEERAQPAEKAAPQHLLSGLSTRDLSPEDRVRIQLPPGMSGAVVSEIEPGSPGDRCGLEQDDAIVAVDRQAIRSAADLGRLVKPDRKEAVLRVYRRGVSTYLVLKR